MTDQTTNSSPSVEGRERLFPRLTPAQLDRLLARGRTRQVAAGEVLLEHNGHTDSFFAILDGEVDIVRPRGGGEEFIVVHGPAEFVGDVHLLSGRRSVVRARARTDGRVIELSRERLLGLIQADAELSAILMRAVILRRVELMSSGAGDVVLVGSGHSSGTLRLRSSSPGTATPSPISTWTATLRRRRCSTVLPYRWTRSRSCCARAALCS
jgi:thioredoxin reductase (NADPH)